MMTLLGRNLLYLTAGWFALPNVSAQDVEPISMFNGKDLQGWTYMQPAERSHWQVGKASLDASDPSTLHVEPGGTDLVNTPGKGIDLYSVDEFGDCRLELEVMVASNSNSGIFLQREYEVQILDSHGREEMRPGDMGGIYGVSAPSSNASAAAGEWQQLVIEFRAPRFDEAGRKTENARIRSVVLNGITVQSEVDLPASTTGTSRPERRTNVLRLQGDHGPVAYRNIRLYPQ